MRQVGQEARQHPTAGWRASDAKAPHPRQELHMATVALCTPSSYKALLQGTCPAAGCRQSQHSPSLGSERPLGSMFSMPLCTKGSTMGGVPPDAAAEATSHPTPFLQGDEARSKVGRWVRGGEPAC